MAERPSNPFGYRFLWWQTALIGIQNSGRIWQVLRDISLFLELVSSPPLWLYLSVSAVWAAVFLKLTWGLWRRRRWAIRHLWLILCGYVGFSLAWLAIFTPAPNLGFVIILTFVVLFVDLFLIRRRNMQRFFDSPGDNQ